jgi:hypothetical protein
MDVDVHGGLSVFDAGMPFFLPHPVEIIKVFKSITKSVNSIPIRM